jgi:PhzF family phenazine biosynthesis protein
VWAVYIKFLQGGEAVLTYNIYQVDAFAENLFEGNPAAVIPNAEGLNEEMMQKIAAENNLSETAFITVKDDMLKIRWFTPASEVDLCGHATLASAHVLFNHEGFAGDTIEFTSKSGILKVSKNRDMLELDFPATYFEKTEISPLIEKALGVAPLEVYAADDYMAVFESEKQIRDMKPDFKVLNELDIRGLIVTAKGENYDFVSRFFAPQVGIDEDPVTGSAHCMLTPYWSDKLGKKELSAMQISERGGKLKCVKEGERIKISGKAVTYMVGEVSF